MNAFKKTVIAGMAAVALVAAGSVTNPTEAQAGGKLAAGILGGLVVGGIIAAATQPTYAAPVYTCTYQTVFKGYNAYGQAVYQQVQVC